MNTLRLESNVLVAARAGGGVRPNGSYRNKGVVFCSSAKPPVVIEQINNEKVSRIGSLSQVSGVLGCQWGDEGKGKLVDILANHFDIVARCQVNALGPPFEPR